MQLGAQWNFVFLIYYMVFKINVWVEEMQMAVNNIHVTHIRKTETPEPNIYFISMGLKDVVKTKESDILLHIKVKQKLKVSILKKEDRKGHIYKRKREIMGDIDQSIIEPCMQMIPQESWILFAGKLYHYKINSHLVLCCIVRSFCNTSISEVILA